MLETKASASSSGRHSSDADAAADNADLTLTKQVTYRDPYGPKEPLIFGGKGAEEHSIIHHEAQRISRVLS
jgi:hypothetical protein